MVIDDGDGHDDHEIPQVDKLLQRRKAQDKDGNTLDGFGTTDEVEDPSCAQSPQSAQQRELSASRDAAATLLRISARATSSDWSNVGSGAEHVDEAEQDSRDGEDGSQAEPAESATGLSRRAFAPSCDNGSLPGEGAGDAYSDSAARRQGKRTRTSHGWTNLTPGSDPDHPIEPVDHEEDASGDVEDARRYPTSTVEKKSLHQDTGVSNAGQQLFLATKKAGQGSMPNGGHEDSQEDGEDDGAHSAHQEKNLRSHDPKAVVPETEDDEDDDGDDPGLEKTSSERSESTTSSESDVETADQDSDSFDAGSGDSGDSEDEHARPAKRRKSLHFHCETAPRGFAKRRQVSHPKIPSPSRDLPVETGSSKEARKKPYSKASGSSQPLPIGLDIDWNVKRVVAKRKGAQVEYKVRWESTWHQEWELRNCREAIDEFERHGFKTEAGRKKKLRMS